MPRKITEEELIDLFAKKEKELNIAIFFKAGEYKTNLTRFTCLCNVCKHKWAPTYSSIRRSNGCPRCIRRSVNSKRKRRTPLNEILTRISKIEETKNIKIIVPSEGLKRTNEVVQCVCGKCEYSFKTSLTSLERRRGKFSTGCPQCSKEKVSTAFRRTEEEFNIAVLDAKHRGITPHFTYNDYKNDREKKKFSCDFCGYVWNTSIVSVFKPNKPSGCKKCYQKTSGNNTRLSPSEIEERIQKIQKDKNITVIFGINQYISLKQKATCFCNRCYNTWSVPMAQVVNGAAGCKKCVKTDAAARYRLQEDEFNKRVKKILEEKHIVILTKYNNYRNSQQLADCLCENCGKNLKIKFASLFNTQKGCRFCAIEIASSKQEESLFRFISETLPKHNVERNNRNILKTGSTIFNYKEIDVFINAFMFGVEFNGNYWHSSKAKVNYLTAHLEKYNLAKEVGIDLIQIFEDEYATNPDLVHSIIRYKVGKPLRTISAADYMLASADTDAATAFVAANSFDTFNPAHKAFALCLQDTCEPVAMFTWHKIDTVIHFQYYVARDTVVVGGLAGLLSTLSMVCPDAVFETHEDARYSLHDKELLGCGFTWSHITEPDRYYCADNYKTRIPAVGENVDNLPEIYGVGHNIYKKA